MDIRSAAQYIRDNVEMQSILDLYGYTTKHGFMVCPFHGDHDASLKVYGGTGGWHCFGCDRGGSVIDFVMEHENCSFRTAVIAIDTHLRLGLMDSHENPEEADAEQQIQKWLDDFVEYVYSVCRFNKRKIFMELKLDLARVKECELMKATNHEKLTAADYDFMNQWSEISQYNEYRLDRIDEFMEEVAAWRRKWRRARSA